MRYQPLLSRRESLRPVSRSLTTIATLSSLAVLNAAALAQGGTHYRVVPLPLPNGATAMSGVGLNNSNEVSGGVLLNHEVRPYHYADGQLTILDEIEGIQTTGLAINDKGHITGWMYEWGVIWPQAYLWDGATNHWLVDPDHSYTYAVGLNDSDQVVGFYYPPNGHANGDAFVVSDGVYHNLGSGQASDISANGIIVGQINRSFGNTAVWTPDGNSGWSRTVLDGLLATAINDSGTMFVGAGPLVSYFSTAALWTRQNGQWTRTDIGNWDPSITNALSNDVNNLGQVVGDYQSFGDENRGWLYENGEVTWLTDLLGPGYASWSIVRAQRINESGVILADAIENPNRVSQPVLLVPEQLTILGPRGDGAGSTNELIAVSAIPGHRIYFAVGLATGSQAVPGCPGVSIGLSSPRLVGSALADAQQQARVSVFVPGAAAGRTVYLQAIDPTQCEVSNVLRYRLR